MKYYKDKTIFITGATSGLGLEMAKQLSGFGANIVLFGRKNLENTLVEVTSKGLGNKVFATYMETTDLDSVKSAFLKGKIEVGNPDIVIHSAGYGRCLPFNETSKEDFEHINNVNVYGSRNVAEASFNYLKESKGQLMFLVSLAGIVTNFGYSAYCSSKFASLALAGVLRSEWKPYGISITAACPPEITTPMVEQERLESPETAKILKKFAGNLEITSACRYMLNGLSKKKFKVIPGFQANFVAFSEKIVPNLNKIISDFVIAKTLKNQKPI